MHKNLKMLDIMDEKFQFILIINRINYPMITLSHNKNTQSLQLNNFKQKICIKQGYFFYF